jgi:small subunit ribosomal protein S18
MRPRERASDDRKGGDRMMGRKRSRYIRGSDVVDYKDYELLRKFMTERGKITPSRFTGATAKQQREIKRAIRRARVMGLLP